MHPIRPGRSAAGTPLLMQACLSLLLTVFAINGYAGDQDFLEAVNEEAKKVEQRQLRDQANANDPDSVATQLPATAPEVKREDVSWQAFESNLAQKYRGTYAFYVDLTQRSKEEIYESYINGVDMDKLREKVMTRYNHEHSKK